MKFSHTPVLLSEVINALCVKPKGMYIDTTLGGGGHSYEIAGRLDAGGALIAFDLDKQAIKAARGKLADFSVTYINDNFVNIKKHMMELGITDADGILFDLGVSSHQLDNPERGFSFHEDARLDMRMSGANGGLSAYDIVNTYDTEDLIRILFEFGEEKFARGIVRGIMKAREVAPVETTAQLAEIIRNNVPLKVRREKNPCRKTFQAIRIAVNNEFDNIKKAIPDAFELLKPGGRLAVITFHSLEDRLVKNMFREFSAGCRCPAEFPICVCANEPKGKLIYRKPIEAGAEELACNPRSRSAKLRVIEKM